MSNDKTFFYRADGRNTRVLRPKTNESEDKAIERLQEIGWNISKGSYHVVDGKSGKEYHQEADAKNCKVCLRRGDSAKETAEVEKPVPKKRGRPKKEAV